MSDLRDRDPEQYLRNRRFAAIIYLIGGLISMAFGIVRHDLVGFAIGVFLFVMFLVSRDPRH